jgi:hypothetical protein
MDAGVLTYLPFRGSRDGTGTAILPGVKPSHQSRSTAPGRHCNAWTTLEEPAGSEHRNGLHRPRPAPRRESPRRRARSSRSRPLTRVRRVPATSAPLLGRSALGLAHGRPEGSSPSAGSSHRPASRGPCRRAAFRFRRADAAVVERGATAPLLVQSEHKVELVKAAGSAGDAGVAPTRVGSLMRAFLSGGSLVGANGSSATFARGRGGIRSTAERDMRTRRWLPWLLQRAECAREEDEWVSARRGVQGFDVS